MHKLFGMVGGLFFGLVIMGSIPMVSFAADPAEVIIQQAETDEGHWVPLGSYKVTFYCNCKRCCGKWAGGPTASETMPAQGRTVACGSLPLGTHILIEGMGERVVEDRGVKGRHIDVYMDSHSECLKLGVKHLQVFRWVQD